MSHCFLPCSRATDSTVGPSVLALDVFLDKAFVDCAVVIMQLAVAVRPAVNCLLRRRLKDFGHAFDVAE